VGATTETYAYAGDGVRLSASTGAGPGQTTKALWDRVFGLPQLALERDGADAPLRAYRYGWDLVSQAAGGNSYAYHHDGLGSVADVTGPSGTSLSWSEYAPYGEVRLAGVGAGAPAGNPFAFTGEQARRGHRALPPPGPPVRPGHRPVPDHRPAGPAPHRSLCRELRVRAEQPLSIRRPEWPGR
jgi:hypothetical protein